MTDQTTLAAARLDREGEPQTRVHLHLYTSDVHWIDSYYGDTIKRSKFVRAAVRKVIRGIEEQLNRGKGGATQPGASVNVQDIIEGTEG